MPSQPDNNSPEGEQRTGLPPTELPTNAKPTPPPTSRWITFLTKMAIASRLMGKEIYRNKLRWFDLRRGHYRLGRKAYEVAPSLPDQSPTVDRLKRIHDRLEALSRPINCGPSSKDKLKATVKGMLRAMKIQILKFRRKRAFRKLGGEIRQDPLADAELSSEIGSSKAVFDRIQSVNAEIRDLAAGTYFWARKPLLTLSIVFALSLAGAGIIHNRALAAPDLSTPRKAVQAFEDALQRNDMALAKSLALASDQQLLAAKMRHDGFYALNRSAIAVNNKFGPEQGTEPPVDYAAELAKLHEQIEGNKATVGGKNSFSLFTPTFKLERTGEAWKLDLRSDTPPSGEDQAIQQRLLKQWNEITQRIEKGDYKTRQEVADAITAAIATLTPATDANPRSQGSEKPGEKAPSSAPSSEATAWANQYRNAKFITDAEFLRRVGPVHLVVRASSYASRYIHNMEETIRESAAKHGITITPDSTDIQLVVDVDLDRATVHHSEGNDHALYSVIVQVGFVTKANCRRGDKFVQLDVYPVRSWKIVTEKEHWGGDYTNELRTAVNGLLDTFAKWTDADTVDDKSHWLASLWPAAEDADMHKNFLSPVKVDTGQTNPIFNGVTRLAFVKAGLLESAGKQFNSGSIEQTWTAELKRAGYKVEPSADLRILHEIAVLWLVYNSLGSALNALEERMDPDAGFYVDLSAVSVSQKNVVFEFQGELRRADVYLWSDLEATMSLSKDESESAQNLVDGRVDYCIKRFKELR